MNALVIDHNEGTVCGRNSFLDKILILLNNSKATNVNRYGLSRTRIYIYTDVKTRYFVDTNMVATDQKVYTFIILASKVTM